MSTHHFLTQNRNLIASAVSAATNPRSSTAIRRTATTRTGNGRPLLTGPYTGSDDTTIDVEVLSGGGTPAASTPVHTGVGTGTIGDVAALAGATSQTYTITLTDTGTETTTASADFDGYTVQARASGAGGNLIGFTVDESSLVYAETNYSLLEAITEGDTDHLGPSWDWGQPVGSADTVPSDAIRVTIGDDRSQVYVCWKYYADGAWHHRMSPAATREYKAGERVYTVTGGRTVTVDNGTTSNDYTSIITLRDLLVELEADPLVEPLQIPAVTRGADNAATINDLRLRTDARIDYTAGSGSEHARGFVRHFAGATAATEIVEARCYGNTPENGASVGAEKWALTGSVSGDLGTLTTGVDYVHPAGRFGMAIPTRLPDGYGEPRGVMGVDIGYVARAGEATPPPICVDERRLGPAARNMSITYVYEERPTGACACDDTAWETLPNAARCLDPEAVDELLDTGGTMDTNLQTRLASLADWRESRIKTHTRFNDGYPGCATYDIELVDLIVGTFADTLRQIYADSTARTDWDSAWTDAKSEFTDLDNAFETVGAITATVYDGASTPVAGERVIPSTPTGYLYIVETAAGAFSATEPTWPTTIGGTVTDTNSNVYVCVEQYWTASTSITAGDIIMPYNGQRYVADSTATNGATYPFTHNSASDYIEDVTDGSVTWSVYSQTDLLSSAECYNDRYKARMAEVLVAAGIDPLFSLANTETSLISGSECWQDTGDTYWWKPIGDYAGYAPAFTNKEYVSIRLTADGEAELESTREFAFVIKVECPNDLQEGDSVTITIGDAGWPPTYQVGDKLTMAVLAAAPLELTNGVTGNDTHTWAVYRSVDGAGTDYSQDLGTPGLYDDGDLQFRLTPGGIAHAEGDTWTLCISSDAYQWRQDSGSWNGPYDIGSSGSLPDGLAVDWESGACPAYVAGDTASWAVEQPYSDEHAGIPTDEPHSWSGTGTVITDTITGTVDAIGILWHDLPSGSSVTVSDGVSLNESLTWREGPMVLLLDAPLTNPTLTWTITSATGGLIYWRWAGEALTMTKKASQQRRLYAWEMAGNQRSRLNTAAGQGVELTWNGFIASTEIDDLITDMTADKASDYPVCVVPHTDHPGEAMLCQYPDDLSIGDFLQYHSADADHRRNTVTLSFAPWLT